MAELSEMMVKQVLKQIFKGIKKDRKDDPVLEGLLARFDNVDAETIDIKPWSGSVNDWVCSGHIITCEKRDRTPISVIVI